MIGRTLNHYRVLDRLGQGGMGEVYLAQDTKLGRSVALKILPGGLALDPDRRARFEREARAVAALNHPGIVTLHSVERDGEVHFLTMELVRGRTLGEEIGPEGIPIERLLDLAVSLADALAAAHAGGIVHRDLKPANVMVAASGGVRILDFGLARMAEPEEPPGAAPAGGDTQAATHDLTLAGRILGTAAYMSPEQAEGRPADPRSDIFSLGVILFQMATGRAPFQGGSPISTLSSILRDAPPSLSSIRPSLPAGLVRIVARCLEKDPERRFQAAGELRDELIGLRSGLASGASAGAPGRPGASGGPAGRRWWLWGLAAAALAVILMAALSRDRLAGRRAAAAPAIDSVAVLPFENEGGDPETLYLSEGIAESLIESLSRVPGLRVAPRSLSFRFRGEAADPRRAAEELRVRAVVTGHVSQRGDSLVVGAELTDLESVARVWGAQYHPSAGELPRLHEEIALEISRQLRRTLTPELLGTLARRGTKSPEAYRELLRSRFYWNQQNPSGLRLAVTSARRAIELDPSYAHAWSALADAYSILGFFQIRPPGEVFPLAREAALKALAIDESIAPAHFSLSMVQLMYDWDAEAARRSAQRALELSPDDASLLAGHSLLLAAMGDPGLALSQAARAVELEPISTLALHALAWSQYLLRRDEEALGTYLRLLELAPDYTYARVYVPVLQCQRGQVEEALAGLKDYLAERGSRPEQSPTLAWVLAASGRREEALRLLASPDMPPAYHAWAALGDLDRAFADLEKAVALRQGFVIYVRRDPRIDALRGDPRFAALVQRLRLP